MNITSFVNWLKESFGTSWASIYKANPASFQQMFYAQNGLANNYTFDEFFEGLNTSLINEVGVSIDNLSSTPQLIFNGSIYKTDNQIMKLATKINELVGVSVEDARSVFANMMNDRRAQNQNPTYDKTAIVAELNDIFEHENVTVNIEDMSYVRIVGKDADGKDIFSTLNPTELNNIITVNQDCKIANMGTGVDGRKLIALLEYTKNEIRNKQLMNLIDEIRFNAPDAEFADKYLVEMHSVMQIEEDIEIFKCLMKHFIWQIKRRIMERPTYNDIMIAMFGAQGVGKSYVVNHVFGGILKKFYNASISLDNLMDERWTVALTNQFLMNIEEMDTGKAGNISGKNLAMVKKIVTGSEATYRPMGTNTTQTIKIKTSFISNANFHIYDIINDETGMRRFFEFNIGVPKGSLMDEKRVARLIEYAPRLFRGVNEMNDRGYWNFESPVYNDIREIQDSYVKSSDIVDFCAKFEVVENMKFEDCIGVDTMYDHYSAYCVDQGITDKYKIKKKNFRRKMEDTLKGCVKSHSNLFRFRVKMKPSSSDPKDDNRPSFTPLSEL